MEGSDKKKNIPVILMLLGGLITVVITFIKDYSILAKLGSLIAVMAVMYFTGTLIVLVIKHFEKVNFEKEEEERKAREAEEELALATDGSVEEKNDEGI
jgi:large-conductance mechanosensitive channel